MAARNMNRSFALRVEDRAPAWRKVNASGKILGRLATEIALILRGKDKPGFTPHTDSGDYVVVTNAEKIKLTGKKMDQKVYKHYTLWIGGLKERTAKEIMAKDPSELIMLAVKRMLPKNRLSDAQMRKLKVYAGEEHPHTAQVA